MIWELESRDLPLSRFAERKGARLPAPSSAYLSVRIRSGPPGSAASTVHCPAYRRVFPRRR